MAITKVQQLQISGTLASRISDSVSNANLAKANRTLEDDLNSLRTQVKLIIGGESWTSALSGSQDLADIYAALRVNPVSGIAGFQSNVFVTGSISGSGNFQVGGNITLQGNLDSDADEAKTLFGSVTTAGNAITLGGGGLVVTAGDLKVGGNDIQASDGTTALTLSGADVTVAGNLTGSNVLANGTLTTTGDAFIGGNIVADAEEAKSIFVNVGANNITIGGASSTVIIGNDLQVNGNDIKGSGGTTSLTLSGADVSVAGDLTVLGGKITLTNGATIDSETAGKLILTEDLVELSGDLKVGGNDIQASDGNVNITMTSNTLTEIKGDLQVSGNDIKSAGGSTAITLDNTNVIVAGDLTVNGTTTTINTVNLEIKDSVVGLGFASGTIQESVGDRGWIGGLAGENNVAFFWDASESEFAVARTTNSATGSLPIPVASYSNFRAAEISGSVVKASLGLSGSLTRLSDGTSYIVGGAGILVSSSSNGQVVISNNAMSQVAKGYLAGNDANINTGTGVVTFGPGGANIGTLSSADDEKIDVFLNGIFMAYGYDISTITTTSFTFDSTIASSLTSDDIISIVLRGTV